MRESQTNKNPYTIIIGDKEVESNLVSYRLHGNQDTSTLEVNKFIKMLEKQIKDYK